MLVAVLDASAAVATVTGGGVVIRVLLLQMGRVTSGGTAIATIASVANAAAASKPRLMAGETPCMVIRLAELSQPIHI